MGIRVFRVLPIFYFEHMTKNYYELFKSWLKGRKLNQQSKIVVEDQIKFRVSEFQTLELQLFVTISEFLLKIEIFIKARHFVQKLNFLYKNGNLCPKLYLWIKIKILFLPVNQRF